MKRTIFFLLILIIVSALFSAGTRHNRVGVTHITFGYDNEKFSFEDVEINELTKQELSKIPYQLPVELISTLTTEELIYYCGDHPTMAINREVWNSEALKEFNGFKELITREKYFNELISVIDKKNMYEKERPERIKYDLGIRLFFSTTLFEYLNPMQKIDQLRFSITILGEKYSGPYRKLFYFFLKECYPEDYDVWGSYIKDDIVDEYFYFDPFVDYLEEKIDQIQGDLK